MAIEFPALCKIAQNAEKNRYAANPERVREMIWKRYDYLTTLKIAFSPSDKPKSNQVYFTDSQSSYRIIPKLAFPVLIFFLNTHKIIM